MTDEEIDKDARRAAAEHRHQRLREDFVPRDWPTWLHESGLGRWVETGECGPSDWEETRRLAALLAERTRRDIAAGRREGCDFQRRQDVRELACFVEAAAAERCMGHEPGAHGAGCPHGHEAHACTRCADDEYRAALLAAGIAFAVQSRDNHARAAKLAAALDVAERALRSVNGTGMPDPEHGHAPMGLFELGLKAAQDDALAHECTYTLEAQRVSDAIEAALATIRAAKGG